MWPSVVMCITMGYLFHVWGGVGVGLFCVVISICTELFLGGEFEQHAAINCFWNFWAALKGPMGGQRPTRTGWLLRRLLLLGRCSGGDGVELLLWLLRLFNDLCCC